MVQGHDAYAAFKIPGYRYFLSAGLLASVGGEVQATAVAWEIYERTGSKAALGYTGLVQFIPVLLLSLPAGHTADRFSRKGQMQASMALMGLASLGLLLLSMFSGPIPLFYVCLLLVGVGRAFNAPARSSLLPHVIPRELLGNAVTWNSSTWQFANVVGPALGGLVVAVTRQAWPAYALAAIFELSSVMLLMPIRPTESRKQTDAFSLRSLLVGVKFVWNTKILLAAITLDLFAVLLGGATALLPVFASDILGVGPEKYGWMRAAPSIGAVAMAICLAHRSPLRYAGPALLVSVAGFGFCTIIFGMSTNYWLSLAMLGSLGALDNISVVIRHTLVQVLTPDSMRGRVGAVNLVFISSSNELGAFESGITAEWFGTVLSVIGGGVGTVLVVILATLRWPQLLTLKSLHSVVLPSQPQMETSNPAHAES